MPFLSHFTQSLLLVVSLSTDAFTASAAYGANKMKIPTHSAMIISLVCSLMLGASMTAGGLLNQVIPLSFARWSCFSILLLVGLAKLFDSCIKAYIRAHHQIRWGFTASDLQFILTVYTDAKKADVDQSKVLSAKESVALAVALSLDGLAGGFGAAIAGNGALLPFCLSLIFTFLSVMGGCKLGQSIQNLVSFDLSYLSAALLILLALLRVL